MSRRIGPVTGTAVFLAACALAVPLLIAAQTLALPAQAPALLVCTAVLFYAAHPLGHAIFARRYGVPVDHFYLGRTDFRRILPVARRLPTVGTRLGIAQLAELSPERRGLIFGGGVITVCVVLALELGYVLVSNFFLPSKALVAVLFVSVLGTEALFSTRAGDLRKMASQRKAKAT